MAEKLIKKRSSMKAKLTNFNNYLDNLSKTNSLSKLQRIELEGRYSKFDALYEVFDELQTEIELLSDETDEAYSARTQFEELYHSLAARARGMLADAATAEGIRESAGFVTGSEDSVLGTCAMYKLPVVLAVLGVATAVPVDSPRIPESLLSSDISTRNSILEDLVQGLIDSVRDVILNGSGDIPVLDPFELDELHLDGDMVDIVDLPDSHVTLKDINVLNLGKFEIDDMSVSIASIIPQRYRITLDGRIPSLDVQTGAYDMLVNIFGGVVFGTGEMKLNVINPRIYGHIVVGMRISISGISLTITSSQLNFSLEAFKPEITGMFGNQAASDFVSTFLSILIPEMTEYFKEDISDIINTVVIEVGNQLLDDMDVGSILPLDSGILSKYSGMQPNPDVIVNSKDM